MIEAAISAAKAAAETSLQRPGEELTNSRVIELGPPRADGAFDDFSIGGDVRSILDALGIDPVALGHEVRAIEVASTSLEQVPLLNSRGEVGHRVSPQEAEHYRSIGLRPREVNGRECLVRGDIDWSQRDAYGQTNLERASKGLPPLDPSGRPYELHHVHQEPNGTLAELTVGEHRGQSNYGILHDPSKRSEVEHGREWTSTRASHWMERAAEVRAQGGV